jgi:hypothetical protein
VRATPYVLWPTSRAARARNARTQEFAIGLSSHSKIGFDFGKLLINFTIKAHMKTSRPAGSRPLSRSVPGPPYLRYYDKHRVVAWQPHGVLDDSLLDEIAEWIVAIEKVSLPFNRFVDFSHLSKISLQIGHVFTFARERAEKFHAVTPVRCALYCDKVVGFGIARLYETLMKDSPIEARAFRDRAAAAEWLEVPAEILSLMDEPAPPT